MSKEKKTAITPTRKEDYPKWYQQVIKAADLAENAPVRGCMTIKPWGYALWENITKVLDFEFKETGVKNAYFPLFIPLSFLEKEATHVEGFAKECAVVTHSRLEKINDDLVPASKLTEPLVVRPTSETIIGHSFSKWINSYRDLPLLINQWCNIVRWEMRTRLFLRTSEFLWQEGHTAHASEEEAFERTETMLAIYAKFVEDYLAIPVVRGEKTQTEKFPGAVNTLCIEAMMGDRKALQAGTSHFLGQNFSKASNIKFLTENKTEDFAWTTSWGMSTRVIGGLIMTHGDDNGIIIPPKITPVHIVLLPIIKKAQDENSITGFVENFKDKLERKKYDNKKLIIEIDNRDTGGARNWDWVKKGIPIIIEIGPKDIQKGSVCVIRRDNIEKKLFIEEEKFIEEVSVILDEIQQNLYTKALEHQQKHTVLIDDKKEFYDFFTSDDENKKIHGGFAMSHWCGSAECERKIKEDLKVTIRCIPFERGKLKQEKSQCIYCNKESNKRVLFAKAY